MVNLQHAISLILCLQLGCEVSKLADPRVPRTELEGTWQAVSMVAEGRKLPREIVAHYKYHFSGKSSVIHVGSKRGPMCEFTLEAGAMPGRIDKMVMEGYDKGKRVLGIY